MGTTRQDKEAMVRSVAERFEKAKALIFSGYRGLRVSEMNELRAKLRLAQGRMQVVKNRMVKRALKEKGIGELDRYFSGPTAVADADLDPAALAKVLVEFAKDHERLELRGGYMEGKQLTLANIQMLAKLPPREVLYAKMLGSLNAPATNLVGVLQGLSRQLVQVINAIKETKTQQL